MRHFKADVEIFKESVNYVYDEETAKECYKMIDLFY